MGQPGVQGDEGCILAPTCPSDEAVLESAIGNQFIRRADPEGEQEGGENREHTERQGGGDERKPKAEE
jgi:hypothetical protein